MIRCANGSFENVNALNSQTKEAEMPEPTYLRSLLFSSYLLLGAFFFNLLEVLFFFSLHFRAPAVFLGLLCRRFSPPLKLQAAVSTSPL
jgi:hypothetical protein